MADTARRFLVGQIVRCPADRGDAGYQGTVTSVGEPLPGKSYRWIEVRHPRGTKHVWPSNRLG
ncbi:MAG: hypothetical protein H5U32_02490 [Pseudomonas balearica]|uniref:hypothetical protein n=1 Tax=Stutzerimonas balearica TaxID=74829 RepID=UPI0019C2FC48|nr:hypothetical protein [Stutzerimonas balearica]MBC7198096.1 hypothetical protein [Stutzerimonas balearica]